jgi:hypothetical protein
MASLKIFHDVAGRTLTVWFAPPELEEICEETGDEIILMKDKTGRVIGFEKLNYDESSQPLQIAFQALQNA